jgi:hypothetical protein
VLLEQPISTRTPLPARELRLSAIPLRRPYISRITAQAGEGAPITPGAAIVVEGVDFLGDGAFVDIDGAPAPLASVDAVRLTLTLPAGLAAGPHALLARRALKLSVGGEVRPAFASNLAAFVLQPVITKTAGNFDIAITNVQGSGAAPRSATITINVAPQIAANQTATLELLNPQGVAYTFMAAPRAAATAQLVFRVAGVVAGDYFVQTRVDGAASPLELDANRAPVAPKAKIP